MTKKLITIALTSLFVIGVSHAQEDGAETKKEKKGKAQRANVEKRFKKLDKNSDSKLDLTEFSALAAMKKAGEERAKEIYGKIDTTKDDGGVTLAEFKAGRKHLAQKSKKAKGTKKEGGAKKAKKSE